MGHAVSLHRSWPGRSGIDGPVGRQIMDKLEEKGLVGLVYWENGFRNVTNSARPIEKFEDFNGIKLRVMPNPVFIDTFKRMGANAVPLPFSELSLRWKPRRSTARKTPTTPSCPPSSMKCRSSSA